MKESLDLLSPLERAVWTSAFASAISECGGGAYAQYPLEDRGEWLEAASSVADNAVAALREANRETCRSERQLRHDLTGIVYKLPPIDFWEGWTTPEEVDVRSRREHTILRDNGIDAEFHSCREEVAIARREIDLCASGHRFWREGPYVSALPEPPGSQLIVAMKGENNGDTYVWSKLPLPWLDSEASFIWMPTKERR